MVQPVHREVHFWNEALTEPPCGTLEDRFAWTDEIEDVTCERCREALAGDSGDLGPSRQGTSPSSDHPAP